MPYGYNDLELRGKTEEKTKGEEENENFWEEALRDFV